MENCCESLVKYFMVFFNILFILAGCILIGFGAWSQVESKDYLNFLGDSCEHSNLPDDRRWCDLPGGLLGLLWRLEGEQVPDLHLRFLPRCYPRRSDWCWNCCLHAERRSGRRGGEKHEQGHGELREAQLRRGHHHLGHCADGVALLWR